MMACKEYMIHTERFSANCIQFGKGGRTLILISGLNVRDAKGLWNSCWIQKCNNFLERK